jgi:hypothetical protein
MLGRHSGSSRWEFVIEFERARGEARHVTEIVPDGPKCVVTRIIGRTTKNPKSFGTV